VRYPSWSLDGPTAIPAERFQVSDAPLALNIALPWGKPTLALALSDGVNEIDAVAPVEVYSYSSAARIVPVASGTSVTTAHGLVVSTTPRDDASVNRTIQAEGFHAAFLDLASRTDDIQARSTAKMIEYPLPAARIAHGAPDLRMPALLALTLLLAVSAGLSPTLIRAGRRRRANRLAS
jgi:hypothetical protein